MTQTIYDFIIIGAGISGLYSAYNILKVNPNATLLVLEKGTVGGRMRHDMFQGVRVPIGAGIGRKHKDRLLVRLLRELRIDFKEFKVEHRYSNTIENPLSSSKLRYIINYLKNAFERLSPEHRRITFKEFALPLLGESTYKAFITCMSYTDYEAEDAYETLYYYGLEDNLGNYIGLSIPWNDLIYGLIDEIGRAKIKTNMEVKSLAKMSDKLVVNCTKNRHLYCRKVIVATTVETTRQLFPNLRLYKTAIHGQTFLRVYAKFDSKSRAIMEEATAGKTTVVPTALQKIIPMDVKKGVYMIAYSDNKSAKGFKNHLTNVSNNKKLFASLVETSLGLESDSLNITHIKPYYWEIGTHYYSPLPHNFNEDREALIYHLQHPDSNIIVVGEAFSRNQGWSEGALESVHSALTDNWILS